MVSEHDLAQIEPRRNTVFKKSLELNPHHLIEMRIFSTAFLAASTLADHGSQIVYDANYCKKRHVQIHIGKRGKIIREGNNSMILRVKNPCSEEANYTAMVIFSRENCGMDFLNHLRDGRIT